MLEPKYPQVKVTFDPVGPSGNVFTIMGSVSARMRQMNVPLAEINQYVNEVSNCESYEAALEKTREWVSLEEARDQEVYDDGEWEQDIQDDEIGWDDEDQEEGDDYEEETEEDLDPDGYFGPDIV